MSIQHLSQLTVVVLHSVTLVHDHVLPANLAKNMETMKGQNLKHEWLNVIMNLRILLYLCQDLFIFNNVLICGQKYIELPTAQDGNKCTTSSWRPLKMNSKTSN